MQGRYPRINEGFNLNHRNNKVNVFTNLSHSHRSTFGDMFIQRNIFDNNGEVDNYFDQVNRKRSVGNNYNGKLGMDYFVNKRTTLGVVLNGSYAASEVNGRNITRIFTPAKELERITNASVDNLQKWNSFNGNVNFRTLLDKKGKELTADLDYTTYGSDVDQFMVNAYTDASGNFLQKADTLMGSLPQDIKVYSGRIDYIHPLKKGARLEAGLKSSIVTTDNNAGYDSIQNGIIVHDIGRSNHFVYDENVNAAYASLSMPLAKKLSTQLGLRMENTNAKGRQLTTGENFNRHYTQLFPTAYFQYKLNNKNMVMVNYGRRVRRPNYQSLNPFIRFIDRYTYSTGNPNLAPQTSDNIEVTHAWRNLVTTTLNYSYTADIFDEVIEQKGQEAYMRPVNIASQRQYGLSVNASTPIANWWTGNVNVNLFNNKYEGRINNTDVSLAATSYIVNVLQQFKLNKTLTAELQGRYRSGWFEGVVRARPVGFVAVGLNQHIMKGNGTVRVAIRDIFYTQKFRGTSKYGNVDFTFQDINDTRMAALSFSYRFSKGKKIAPVKRTAGSANEELQRLGTDN
jgi:iron complex outermembrane recepter protein